MPNDTTIVNINNKGVDQNSFDAIVIGSGMSGGWAAKELCDHARLWYFVWPRLHTASYYAFRKRRQSEWHHWLKYLRFLFFDGIHFLHVVPRFSA